MTASTPLTYAAAGVDIDAGNALVDAIKPLAAATKRPGTLSSLGGFGALFDLKGAGFADPIVVSTTDGVGTKLRLAIDAGVHDTVGIDLVAMCVNDLLAQGATPLFFLDYFATGKLELNVAKAVIAGIAEGCKQAGCALIGGETAEMPGMYHAGDYDLAGFAVGAVERAEILPRQDVKAGDVVIGLASSGVHSNGFSLVRKVLERAGLTVADAAPFDAGKTIAQSLLTPTRIYVNACLEAIKTGHVKALAHITGGGIVENLPRVLPASLAAEIDTQTWKRPAIFGWLQQNGGVPEEDLWRTFNMGVGMALVVERDAAKAVIDALEGAGEQAAAIGEIVMRHEHGVELV